MLNLDYFANFWTNVSYNQMKSLPMFIPQPGFENSRWLPPPSWKNIKIIKIISDT